MSANDRPLWPKGLKKTRQRLLIFEALCESDKPISARELCSLLEQRGTSIWLSTIYRVLDTLLAHGMIQKAAVHEDGMALYVPGDAHRHYAVCMGCRRVIVMRGVCPLDYLTPDLLEEGFHVFGHKLQISGYCGECYLRLHG